MRSPTSPPRIQNGQGTAPSLSIADFAVYAYVLLMGAFEFTHYARAANFLVDTTYPDLARSILERGLYQVRFLPETTLPPGFPLILAVVGRFFGFSPSVLFPVIAVCAALGLIAAYELLRRVEGRGFAAAACLLLASSPALFIFNATVIFPEMPYFLASMLALLLALRIDRARPGRALIGWQLLLGAILVAALLIRSVGIALLVGLVTWGIASLVLIPQSGKRRIKRFALPLVLGLTAQLAWGAWAQRHQTREWELPGYPQSYISQLRVKDGQHPELGLARLADIPSRVAGNLILRTVRFGEIMTGKHISRFWPSPAISGVVILIAVGLLDSIRNGGELYDWYFLWYEAIFLLWPWETRDRFLFPILPLACLYLWRGAKTLQKFWIHQPGKAALSMGLGASFLALSSGAFALRLSTFTLDVQHLRADRLQPVAAALFWSTLAVMGFGTLAFRSLRGSNAAAGLVASIEAKARFPLLLIANLVVAALVMSGVRQLIRRGLDNLRPDVTRQALYPEIEASQWITAHEPSSLVIMARASDFVFHYTQRHVVWFPPISDPQVLMEGIRRHHVDLIVVAHHPDSFYRPSEDECFQALLKAYGSAFQLRHDDPTYLVYEVLPSQDAT